METRKGQVQRTSDGKTVDESAWRSETKRRCVAASGGSIRTVEVRLFR